MRKSSKFHFYFHRQHQSRVGCSDRLLGQLRIISLALPPQPTLDCRNVLLILAREAQHIDDKRDFHVRNICKQISLIFKKILFQECLK